MAALQLDDLTVRVSPTTARLRVTVTAAEGEVVGIAVASAAEGRALARTVAGLAAPLDGRVLAGRDDVTDRPVAKRGIGYIPAGGGLLPHLTVAENITYGIDEREQIRGLVSRKVVELTTQLELVGIQGRLPHTVTPEQRLRTAIARAVLRYPTSLVVEIPAADAVALRRQDVRSEVQLPVGDPLAVIVCSDDETLLGRLDRTVPVTAAT